MDTTQIRAGQVVHVIGKSETGTRPGEHVGTVDHMDGEFYIKLARSDSEDGKHHWVPVSLVTKVEPDTIYLNCTKDEFAHWLLDSPEPRPREAFRTQP